MPTLNLRYVERAGIKILQQEWVSVTSREWRDVPVCQVQEPAVLKY
jgi:hypothetical protein